MDIELSKERQPLESRIKMQQSYVKGNNYPKKKRCQDGE